MSAPYSTPTPASQPRSFATVLVVRSIRKLGSGFLDHEIS